MLNEVLFRLKSLNWFFISIILFLTFVGFVMIYSATFSTNTYILMSHLTKILIGFLLMMLVGIINIDFWKRYAFYLYLLGRRLDKKVTREKAKNYG